MMFQFENQESKQIQFHNKHKDGNDPFPITFGIKDIINIEGNGFGLFKVVCKYKWKWTAFFIPQNNLINEIIGFLQGETDQLILFYDDELVDEFKEGMKQAEKMADLHQLWINEIVH